jgi:ferredoxin
MQHNIHFQNEQKKVTVGENENPSEVMNVTNSPVLFGCRTGICGTCLVNVLEGADNIVPSSEDEKEILEIMAPDYPNARLMCQVKLQGDIKVEYIGK